MLIDRRTIYNIKQKKFAITKKEIRGEKSKLSIVYDIFVGQWLEVRTFSRRKNKIFIQMKKII